MVPVVAGVFLSGMIAGRLVERRQQRRRAGGGGSGGTAAETARAAAAAATAATAADGGAARPLTPPEVQPHQPHSLHHARPHALPHSDSYLRRAEPATPTAAAVGAPMAPDAQELPAAQVTEMPAAQPQPRHRWRLLGLIPMGRAGAAAVDGGGAEPRPPAGGARSSERPAGPAPAPASAFAAAASGISADAGVCSTGRTSAAGSGPPTPPHPHLHPHPVHDVPPGTPFAPTTGRAPSAPAPSPAPSRAPSSATAATGAAATAVPEAATHLDHPRHVWYVGEQDLQYFRLRAEQDVPLPGAGPWTHMMDKESARGYRYTAHRRALPSGLTEYRSVTVIPDTSPLEYVDFSLDDTCRCRWEGFMVSAEVLEAGDQRLRQQVVRWIRTFPFGFITDRQYVIARALFAVTPDGVVHRGLPPPARLVGHPSGPSASLSAMQVADLYVVTKSIGHPGAADGQHGKVVTIPEYYSMWRCRTVACPWGGGRPAVEVVLLHSEDMRIPERLARMAISMGMSKFVATMAAAVPGFVAERRRRGLAPTQPDPQAYGHHHHVYGRSARAIAARAAEEQEAAAVAAAAAPASHEPRKDLLPATDMANHHRQLAAAATPPLPAPPATPHAAAPASAAATPSSAASQPWTPFTATPSSGGSSAFSTVSTPTGPSRALWRPHVRLPPSPWQPPDSDSTTVSSGGGSRSGGSSRGVGSIPRFSLAQVAVGGDGSVFGGTQQGNHAGGAGVGAVPQEQLDHSGFKGGEDPAVAESVAGEGRRTLGGSEGVVADAWWSLGRAMSSTGLWHRQDLPQMSSAWGTDPGRGKRKRGGGGFRRRVLMTAAAAALAGVLLARRVSSPAVKRPQRNSRSGSLSSGKAAAGGIAASPAAGNASGAAPAVAPPGAAGHR